jgi:DNA-binding transcriptional LysR family regulator
MELYQIKHFIAVAETGGFTKGAQRVAISQPAISASIAKLETELDVKLLDRRRSGGADRRRGAFARSRQEYSSNLQCGESRA